VLLSQSADFYLQRTLEEMDWDKHINNAISKEVSHGWYQLTVCCTVTIIITALRVQK